MHIWRTAHGARSSAEAPRGQRLCVRVQCIYSTTCVGVCASVFMCVPVCKTVPTQAHTATCQGASGVCMFVFWCLQMHIYLCVCTWTLVCWDVPRYTYMSMFVCLVYTHTHTRLHETKGICTLSARFEKSKQDTAFYHYPSEGDCLDS